MVICSLLGLLPSCSTVHLSVVESSTGLASPTGLVSPTRAPVSAAAPPSPRPSVIPVPPRPALRTPTLPTINGDGVTHDVLFSVPIGAGGVYYRNVHVPEALPDGPAAVAAAPDGTFWLADTVANRLVHYDHDGMLLAAVNLAGIAVGVVDLEATGTSIWLLDQAAIIPTVLRLSPEGQPLSRYDLPEGSRLEDGLTGIALSDHGEVLVEFNDGTRITQLIDANGLLSPGAAPGYQYSGRTYRVEMTSDGDQVVGHIVTEATTIDIHVPNRLGGVRLLGVRPDHSLYVLVDELITESDGRLRVDSVVHWYREDGRLLGLARFPLQDQVTPVEHPLAVGPEGTVYGLITRPEHVEIQRLRFARELVSTPIAP